MHGLINNSRLMATNEKAVPNFLGGACGFTFDNDAQQGVFSF